MVGTLSMLALVALGFTKFNLLIILPFAIVNALVGVSQLREPADWADPAPGFFAALAKILPMQVLFAAIGYALGYGAALFVG